MVWLALAPPRLPGRRYKRDVGGEASTSQHLLLEQAQARGETAPSGGGLVAALAAAARRPLHGDAAAAAAAADGAAGDGGGGADAGDADAGADADPAGRAGRMAFPVSAADVAIMLEVCGVDRIITVDMRLPGQGQSEGFFSIPVENIRSTRLAVEHMVKLKPRLQNVVVVAPNEACLRLAQDFQAGLSRLEPSGDVGVALIIEAGPSRGADRYMHERDESRLDIVGDVMGACGARRDGARGGGAPVLPRLTPPFPAPFLCHQAATSSSSTTWWTRAPTSSGALKCSSAAARGASSPLPRTGSSTARRCSASRATSC